MSKLRFGALALALWMVLTVAAPAVQATADTVATQDGSMPPMPEGGPTVYAPRGLEGQIGNLTPEQQALLRDLYFFLGAIMMLLDI